MSDTRTKDDLLSLLRFRVLDYRNATEEARERLMLEAADEIERLRAEVLKAQDNWVRAMDRCDRLFEKLEHKRATDETALTPTPADPSCAECDGFGVVWKEQPYACDCTADKSAAMPPVSVRDQLIAQGFDPTLAGPDKTTACRHADTNGITNGIHYLQCNDCGEMLWDVRAADGASDSP